MFAEQLLGVFFPWLVAFFLLVFLGIHIVLIPRLFLSVWNTKKMALFLAGALLIGGAYLRFAVVPNQHRIFYDEDRYLGYSVSFARLNKAVSLELATPQETVIGKPDQAVRVTVPVLHGMVLKLFGFDEAYLFHTSRILSLLLAAYIAVLSYQLFRSVLGAILSMTGMLFLPIQLYWSASMALDPYFVFFTVASVVALLLYLRRPTRLSIAFSTTSIFLLLCVRIEAFVVLPLLGYLAIMHRRRAGEQLFQSHDRIFLMILAPLILMRGVASISVLGQKWCCADSLPLEAFSLKYITRNLLPNVMYFITGFEFPYILSLPALWLGLSSRKHTHRFLLFWIVAFFILYSLYYAGLFVTAEFSGSYARYFLIMIPPLLLLFSDTVASHLIPHARQAIKNGVIALICIAVGSAQLTYSFWSYRDLIVYPPSMFNAVDQGPIYVHAYLENVLLPSIPKHAVVIHPITSIPLLHGHTTVYYQYFLENDETITYVHKLLKSGKRVFTMNAIDCSSVPYKCEKINRVFVAKRSPLNKPETSSIFQIYELFLK